MTIPVTFGVHEVKRLDVSNIRSIGSIAGENRWYRDLIIELTNGDRLEVSLFGDNYGAMIFNFEEDEE